MLLKILRFIVALALLFVMLYLGKVIAWLIPIGIPESIWGLLLLFCLLVLGIIKVEWISPASRPLLRYMTLFFLPVCPGIMEQGSVLTEHFSSLVIANFISTILGLVIIGYLAQWLFQRNKPAHEENSNG